MTLLKLLGGYQPDFIYSIKSNFPSYTENFGFEILTFLVNNIYDLFNFTLF